jgi:hypothetical protein
MMLRLSIGRPQSDRLAALAFRQSSAIRRVVGLTVNGQGFRDVFPSGANGASSRQELFHDDFATFPLEIPEKDSSTIR